MQILRLAAPEMKNLPGPIRSERPLLYCCELWRQDTTGEMKGGRETGVS
jgi:hypothetical protein